MMQDLPTDWPPKNTIFIFVLPVIVLIEWFIFEFKILYLDDYSNIKKMDFMGTRTEGKGEHLALEFTSINWDVNEIMDE
jgi:hypothetical protein